MRRRASVATTTPSRLPTAVNGPLVAVGMVAEEETVAVGAAKATFTPHRYSPKCLDVEFCEVQPRSTMSQEPEVEGMTQQEYRSWVMHRP